MTEGDQCWALIKVTTGGLRNLPLPVFDPHHTLEQYKISSSEQVVSVKAKEFTWVDLLGWLRFAIGPKVVGVLQHSPKAQ